MIMCTETELRFHSRKRIPLQTGPTVCNPLTGTGILSKSIISGKEE